MSSTGRCYGTLAFILGLAVLAMAFFPEQPIPAADAPQLPFQVPPGFVVERVAGPPLVDHPVMAGFDERGRLFVAESAGLNLKADELLKRLPDSIRLLEDTKGNGVFDKATVFADKMSFPMGAQWHRGALYVCSPPSLWKLEDTTGKGVADKRTELVTKFGFSGNAADIHGPFLGPDGWLYWTDGRHGHQIAVAEGKELKGKAARIFRCKPNGKDIEVVCGGGMDDPVKMAFTPEGEAFATVDILVSRPSRNDAIIHCIEGGVFPYNEVYKEFKSTGDLLPPVTWLGWVAPSGLMRYRSTAVFFPTPLDSEKKNEPLNLFSALFNTHKVQRHILERDGATFKSKNEDFLVSTDPNFHPTDVLEDADGSLLVIDTGGWFRIGCPTSQLAKPEIKGGIYRIRRKDQERIDDPWGLKIAWNKLSPAELAKLLNDRRWAVRDRAIEQLAQRGKEAVPTLQETVAKADDVQARRNAVWALTRMESAEARAVIRQALKDKDASVRNTAAHAVGLYRDAEALPHLILSIRGEELPAVRRELATALGRLGDPKAAGLLRFVLKLPPVDRFLEHSIIYALIQIGDRAATLPGLSDDSPLVRRATLIALDQMPNGNLTREQVVPLLDTDDAALQKAVLTTVIARPEWAPQLVEFLRGWLLRTDLSESRQEILRQALVAFAKDAAIQSLVVQSFQQEKTPTAARLLLLEAVGQAPLDKLPPAWLTEIGRCLEHREERVARQAVALVRSRGLKDFDAVLQRLSADRTRPAELRVAALGTVMPRLIELDPAVFDFVLARLDAAMPPLDRLAAASALGPAHLNAGQLERLLPAIAGAGALEMPHLIGPFERSKDAPLGRKLLAALDKAPGLTSLSPEALRRVIKDYPDDVKQAAQPLLARLEVDADKQKARLTELAPVLTGGDAKRGRNVFFGNKAACSTCHLVKNEGGQIGPDLSTIGAIRTGRDLLEAIVFPSASFVRGYEPYVVATKDGKVHAGILRRETTDAIYLVTAERSEVRVPRAAIDTIEPGRVSIMPQGLDMQLNRQELSDLIAFMLALK